MRTGKFNIMKTIIFCFLMFLTLFVSAQNDKISPDLPGSYITIQMAKFPVADFPENSIPISNIRVFQAVRDSVSIGYATKGLIGSVASLKTPKPLTISLQEQIKRMYKHEYKKDGAELFWVVKNLRLGERRSVAELAYTRLNADAYISKDGKLFKKVCSMDTVFMTETTEGHGDNIERALKVFLKRTLLFAADALEQSTNGFTVDRVTEQAQQKDDPIIKDSIYSEGAYLGFEDFLQNKPSVTDYELATNEKKELKFVKPGQNGQKEAFAIWGLCKGGEIYKNYEGTLIPIEKHGTGFIISNYVQRTNKTNRNLFFSSMTGAMVGGAIGGLMVASAMNEAAAKNQPVLVRSIPYITDPNMQPLAICIDMMTGEFAF